MAEFQINTITLPKLTNNVNDMSLWFDQLEEIGFTKVYYNDTLQVNKIRWKDSYIGLAIESNSIYYVTLKTDNTYTRHTTIWNNAQSYTTVFYYRYINNTNNILFGAIATATPSQRLNCTFYSPEYEGDSWNVYFNGYIVANSNENQYEASGKNFAAGRYPATSVALCPLWASDRFKQKVYYVPILPALASWTIQKVIIGDKTYLIDTWASSQYCAIAFDITEEFG